MMPDPDFYAECLQAAYDELFAAFATPAAAPTAPRPTAKSKRAKGATAAARSLTMSDMRDKIVEPLKAAGEQIKAAGQQVAETTSTLNAKIIDHAEANVREAFAALRAAATSKSLTDVMTAQTTYVREQGERGMAQVKEIGEIIANFGREAMKSVTGKE